ncbi:MAG: hypothetical protein AAFX53_00155 [Bacteroidota bacterium]
MNEHEFNPVIQAVVSIRHLAKATSENWSSMKTLGSELSTDLEKATSQITNFASEDTRKEWLEKMNDYSETIQKLKQIMAEAISKIREKKAGNIADDWNHYPKYVEHVEELYEQMKSLGLKAMPENETASWEDLWRRIDEKHEAIKNEAYACSMQLQMIQNHDPKEVDQLNDSILKHIPLVYTNQEAQRYTEEYMRAYEQLKKEASQKKTLWDKFLDILAGGTQQTPAQRVMMQRWVDGEKI